MKARARGRARWALAGCALALGGACGDDPRPSEVELRVSAAWNDDPASTAEIGYEVQVEVEMLGRGQTCFPLPDLRITVNESEHPIAAGDCQTEVRVRARPVRADADIVVRLSSGHGELGAATFRGLFPGFGALQIVSPADGRVRMGETLALAIPTPWPLGDSRFRYYVQWLDPAPSVPPFHSPGSTNVNGAAFEMTAPMLTGRALVVLEAFSSAPASVVSVQACTGFAGCRASSSSGTLGPVAIEVIP